MMFVVVFACYCKKLAVVSPTQSMILKLLYTHTVNYYWSLTTINVEVFII